MGLTGKAIFHDDFSDASSDYSDSNKSESSSSADSAKRLKIAKKNSQLHLRREITYTAYGEHLHNTVKLLSSNKNAALLDQKVDIKARRFFVTSSASKFEHRQFFGNTKTAIWENIQKVERPMHPIKRSNFLDRTTRVQILSYVKKTIDRVSNLS